MNIEFEINDRVYELEIDYYSGQKQTFNDPGFDEHVEVLNSEYYWIEKNINMN